MLTSVPIAKTSDSKTPRLAQNSSFLFSPYTAADTVALALRYIWPDERLKDVKSGCWEKAPADSGLRRLPQPETKVLFLGDLMVGSSAAVGGRLRDAMRAADYVVINLETPIHAKPPATSTWAAIRESLKTCFLSFSADISYVEKYVDFLDRSKVIFNVANNHALDGDLTTTVRVLEDAGFKNIVGTGVAPLVLSTATGAKIGLLGCTTLMNWGRYDTVCLANDVLDLAENPGSLQVVKDKHGVKSLTLTVHWDHEYSAVPGTETVAAAAQFADRGVDAIVGHGPHIVQRTDAIAVQGQNNKQVPVAYSIGNFVSRKLNLQNATGYACTVSYGPSGSVDKLTSATFRNNGTEIELTDCDGTDPNA